MHVSSTYRPQNQPLPQRNLSAAAPYTFSAKERDVETGLSYFGARYYSSDLSIWLSIDPMSAKYPSLSPYVYCANNPIKLVDPNGEEIVGTDGKAVTYSYDEQGKVIWSKNASDDIKRIGNAMLQTETGKEQLDKAISSQTKITFQIKDRRDKSTIMGDAQYGIPKDYDGTTELKSATINIYEQSIKEILASGEFGSDPCLELASYWASQDGDTGLDNYIGAVAGHEIEHIVSQANRVLCYNYRQNKTAQNKSAKELVPNIIKVRILWEMYVK